ncbi:hypothetical protein Mal15_47630 [Stieleria maiorica]|uniref:Uncharacterized protein n=1 Tax=Stieleria maiorica TaxID=2795974 RepID=A0A5B9MHD2_9BACT|nr:hypothetical protein Mal15_47630 [Stieleria maiorica]
MGRGQYGGRANAIGGGGLDPQINGASAGMGDPMTASGVADLPCRENRANRSATAGCVHRRSVPRCDEIDN